VSGFAKLQDLATVSILRDNLQYEMRRKPDPEPSALEKRMAGRLAALRAERGWSLEKLAKIAGISRATLSRIERCELSPTAGMLWKLCGAYGWTMSRLIGEADGKPPSLVRAADQPEWQDPGTKYRRRIVSPPGPELRGEMVEVRLPPGAIVAFDESPMQGLEHHLWMLEGTLDLTIEGTAFRLRPGDCVRYVLNGTSRFECKGKGPARYVIAMVHT
jgi:transcriptional regulator with XRE-family HTH domain